MPVSISVPTHAHSVAADTPLLTVGYVVGQYDFRDMCVAMVYPALAAIRKGCRRS